MKLTLKNFRCYTDQTFEFDDDTITLINGPSGHGKTTILLAIQFALYGSSNHKYLVSHNKVSCEVTLCYKNFMIKRTKRPNILNVEIDGKLYEDKEAQVILNKYFGITNSSVFFMDLSTEQKMEFLEKIVNEDCDVKDLKTRIKNEISRLSKELAILDGQISNTESMLEIIQKPTKIEKPYFEGEVEPLREEEFILRRKQTIKQLEEENLIKIKYNDLMVELNVIQDEIDSLCYEGLNPTQQKEDLVKELDILKVKNNQLNKKKEDFLIVEESIKELEKFEDIKEGDLTTLTQKIQKLDQDIDLCIKFKDLQSINKLEAEYKDGYNQETLEHSEKVDFIHNQINILNNGRQSPKLKDSLKNLEQVYSKFEVAQTFISSNHKIEEIMDQITTLKSKFFKSFSCGKCNHSFLINMDTFEKVECGQMEKLCSFDQTTQRLNEPQSKIKNKLRQLEILKDKLKHDMEFVETINIYEIMAQIDQIKKRNELNEKLNNLGSFKPSSYLNKMEKKILKLRSSLPLDCKIGEAQRLGVQGLGVQDLNVLKDERRDLTIQLNTLTQRLMVKNNHLKKIQKRQDYDSNEHSQVVEGIERCMQAYVIVETQLEKFKNKERLEGKLSALKETKNNIKYNDQTIPRLEQLLIEINYGLEYHIHLTAYQNFQIQLRKYKKVKETLNNFILKKENMEQTYLKTLVFKQKVIEAEHESLEQIINTINSHLTILLQDFFSESFGDPIQIYLELVSEKRPQVNTIINYKGNRVDYKALSTGEYARVKLAFDLTFKEILGENIIMLDECTANLDQDLSTKIFNKIKATFPSKTILVVAHQVVMGTFDHILSL